MSGIEVEFVRSQMLPPELPPVSQRGAVKWGRENLFSSPLNTTLTLLSLLALYYLVSKSLPWLLNGVWNANSLRECRDIIIASAGPDAPGACWALIRARWHQFIFGFYPPPLWWRPILTFALLFVALAPVLYYGSVIAETVRAGIQAISRGQSEAAFALGLRPGRTMTLVILPQALRVIIPPLISQFLSLTKDTSLGIAVSYLDLRGTLGGITLNQTGRELECMMLMMLIYLIISLIISGIMNIYNASVKLKER